MPGGSLTVHTDANGRWEFPVIPRWTYSVVEQQPKGYDYGLEQNADPNGPNTVIVGNDRFDNIQLLPFPDPWPVQLRGSGGQREYRRALRCTWIATLMLLAIRPIGLPGATVQLTGVDDTGLNVTATVVTDANGNFLFQQMRPGTYQVTKRTPSVTSTARTGPARRAASLAPIPSSVFRLASIRRPSPTCSPNSGSTPITFPRINSLPRRGVCRPGYPAAACERQLLPATPPACTAPGWVSNSRRSCTEPARQRK